MTAQGWSEATFRCGSCGHSFTAATEAEYVERYAAHQSIHAIVAALAPAHRSELEQVLLTVEGR